MWRFPTKDILMEKFSLYGKHFQCLQNWLRWSNWVKGQIKIAFQPINVQSQSVSGLKTRSFFTFQNRTEKGNISLTRRRLAIQYRLLTLCMQSMKRLQNAIFRTKFRPKVLLKVKVQVFDTPQVVNCFKVESDAALLPS